MFTLLALIRFKASKKKWTPNHLIRITNTLLKII